MTLYMSDEKAVTMDQLEAFTLGTHGIVFQGTSRKEKYEWIESVLKRFMYFTARKKSRTTVQRYIRKVTGYSKRQLKRLVKTMRKEKHLTAVSSLARTSFPTTYTTDDVAFLLLTDNAHDRLSGQATKELFIRAWNIFGDARALRLKDISVAHLYRLRGRRQYVSGASTFTKTVPTSVPIGIRRKPDSQGKPGHIRVDSVHQGDQDKEKGVYHVNLVDEVTQWEIVGCVQGISERFLVPLLETLLEQFPFRVLEFHSDNGSEYINYVVAKLLNKLSIEQTKSRPRRCNDNALVEGKNGSVIRKHMGYAHIPREHAPAVDAYYQQYFNTYINYHRPCGYATEKVDAKGKVRKVYDRYQTPYAHLKALPDAHSYLKEGLSFEALDRLATVKTDLECATLMKEAKETLLDSFRK